MISSQSYLGAKWWRCDLHIHTSASRDTLELQDIPLDTWLLNVMSTGVDVIAITDHNSGSSIDPIKAVYQNLATIQPRGFKKLYIFPGVEISTLENVHILALFDPSKGTAEVEDLLVKLDIPRGKWGETEGVFSKYQSSDVIKIINQSGALAIPAHVNKEKGIFQLSGNQLRSLAYNEQIIAIEHEGSKSEWPDLIKEQKPKWVQILGSDCHQVPGSIPHKFTWIKMRSPTLEGLKLACIDGNNSVKIMRDITDDLTLSSHPWIRSVTITDTEYIDSDSPFLLCNPGLNTIIGGRGTGKSSTIEFIRLCTGRTKEIPDTLTEDLKKYFTQKTHDPSGLLHEKSKLMLEYQKDDALYRIRWRIDNDKYSIYRVMEDGSEELSSGEIKNRFPLSIYSQKQIYEMVRDPSSILHMIDQDPDTGFSDWEQKFQILTSRYKSLQAKIREITASLPDKERIRGELEDISSKISRFEESGHADILKKYQQTRGKERAIEIWEESWKSASYSIISLIEQIGANDPDISVMDRDDPDDQKCARDLEERTKTVNTTIRELHNIAKRLESQWADWKKIREESEWSKKNAEIHAQYSSLMRILAEGGISDIQQYGQLLQTRETLEEQIRNYNSLIFSLEDYSNQEKQLLKEITNHRLELTRKRKEFIRKNLAGNKQIRMVLLPFGDHISAERKIRSILGLDKNIYAKYIHDFDNKTGIIDRLYTDYDWTGQHVNPDDFLNKLHLEKEYIYDLCDGKGPSDTERRFIEKMIRCPQDQRDELAFFYPEDSLSIGYYAESEGIFKDIMQGSPGQKNAVILSFILSYGTQPLILDQPEDDLDNHLIYDMIVRHLRNMKEKRQIIIVTHNANIVVNGNADLVIPLIAEGGETIISHQGTLQDEPVRDEICRVMEGGRTAFEMRYKRILREFSC